MRLPVPSAARRWLRSHGGPLGSIVRVKTDAPEFVLTYDDGPDPNETERLLDVLAAHKASATFFVLMTRARAYKSILQSTVDAGHEIALHGPDHQAISRLGYRAVRERIAASKTELEDQISRQVRWFRPPYGLQSIDSFRATKANGLEPVLWGPTAWDSREATQDQRVARAVRGAERGSILLSHDAYAGSADGGHNDAPPQLDRSQLATRIISAYAELNLHPRSLGHVLTSGHAVKGFWFKR